MDFPSAITRKRRLISRHPPLSSLTGPPSTPDDSAVTVYADLSLIGADLRDLPQLQALLVQAGVQFDVPTFVLSECVLVYLRGEEGTAVVRWVGETFKGGVVMLAYEQLHPETAFGRVMVQNLEVRGCPLLGLGEYPTVEAQRGRYEGAGFESYEGWDMLEVWGGYLEEEERRRAERVEGLDELEEWNLIQSHYHISMAARGRRRGEGESEAVTAEREPMDGRVMRAGLLGAVKPEKVGKSRGGMMGEYGRAGPLGGKAGPVKVEGVGAGPTRYHPVVTASPAASPSDGSA